MILQDVIDKINSALADKAAAQGQSTVITQARADAQAAASNAQHQVDLGATLDARAAQSVKDAEALLATFLEGTPAPPVA